MLDLKRFRILHGKAKLGLKNGCQPTGRAYWRMAQAELLDRIEDLSKDRKAYEMASSAYVFITEALDKEPKLAEQLNLAGSFWKGYDLGQKEDPFPDSGHEMMQTGYGYGVCSH